MHNIKYYEQNDNNLIPIVRKAIDLYKQYYNYLPSFPRKDRYAIGLKTENIIINTLECFLQAGLSPKNRKIAIINKANNNFELLKVFIRLMWELKIIDHKKYLVLQQYMSEIGKMLGGWINYIAKVKASTPK